MGPAKLIRTSFFFFLFAVLFYVSATFLWGLSGIADVVRSNMVYLRDLTDFMPRRLEDAKKEKNVDILVLGSSHAYRGFDPRIFSTHGFSLFILGSSAQTPVQTKLLLDRYLDGLQPELVIYEVYPHLFQSDGIESTINIIASDKNDLASVKMALATGNMKVYNSLLYTFMSNAFMPGKKSHLRSATKDDTYVPGGYVEKRVAYATRTDYPPRTIRINPEQLRAFREALSMLKEKKISVILVYAPLAPACYEAVTNNDSIDSLLSSCGEYYNFNRLVKMNDSLHFFDGTHLNQDGVAVFNEQLIRLLKERTNKKSR